MGRPLVVVALALAVAAVGCGGSGSGSGAGAGVATRGPVAEARALMEQGQLDEALAKLEQAPSEPEALYVQGLVWMKKAEQAPPPEPEEEGGRPPEFKLEERNALAFFETVTSAMPDHAGAQLATARLLAPHALHKAEEERSRRRRRRGSEPSPDPELPDYSPERVIAAYDAAARADATAEPVDARIDFCTQLGDLDCADAGYQQLLERVPESPVPHIRYGDFLRDERKDVDAALSQYELALVWAPDDSAEDAETRRKVAAIYIARGEEHLDQRRWALADQALKSARKYVSDPRSEQGQRLTELEARLAAGSGRRF